MFKRSSSSSSRTLYRFINPVVLHKSMLKCVSVRVLMVKSDRGRGRAEWGGEEAMTSL